jgi:hypothetical protein
LAFGGVVGNCFTGFLRASFLPVLIAAAVGCRYISWNNGYQIQLLRDIRRQVLILGRVRLIWLLVCLAANVVLPITRRTPQADFVFGALTVLALLVGLRLLVIGFLGAWTPEGFFDRKIAILGLNDVSPSYSCACSDILTVMIWNDYRNTHLSAG